MEKKWEGGERETEKDLTIGRYERPSLRTSFVLNLSWHLVQCFSQRSFMLQIVLHYDLLYYTYSVHFT